MVNIDEDCIVREYSSVRNIGLFCVYCNEFFADYIHVRNFSRSFWQISRSDVSWDAKFTVQSDSIICQCAERLGNACLPNIYVLSKKAFKLIY